MKYIDNFLNSVTMYWLVLTGLIVTLLFAMLFGFLGIVSYSGASIVFSVLVLFVVCYGVNWVFAKIYRVQVNEESPMITALILACILAPAVTFADFSILVAAGAIAMGSKYILAINRKHIFNPAAISIFILGVLGSGAAIWWIATPALFPIVLIIGLLIIRKTRRFYLLFSFIIAALASILFFQVFINHAGFSDTFTAAFLSWPLIFFGTVMLTEPQTSPTTKNLRIVYGVLVGILFGAEFHFGPIFATPETALVAGNIFAYFVSPKYKLRLKLKNRKQLAPDIYEISFSQEEGSKKISFKPGQYFELTLAHKRDSRGNRRYFTISSSPTEKDIAIATRVALKNGSSFKNKLQDMKESEEIMAGQLGGDFTLPEDQNKKLVFIAGGIGITPFRSMIKYLLDTEQKREIILFYAAQTADRFVYKGLFDEAQKIGLKTVYIFLDTASVPADWSGDSHVGFITKDVIKKHVPEHGEYEYYLSGPNAMVNNYKKLLLSLGIKRRSIKTDYFPGF